MTRLWLKRLNKVNDVAIMCCDRFMLIFQVQTFLKIIDFEQIVISACKNLYTEILHFY